MGEGEKIIATNRRARHDYHVLDTWEAGIALQGTEVKSMRMTAGVTIKDSFAEIRGGEVFLVGTHIEPYDQGNRFNHKPERERKLLLHRDEIKRMHQKVSEKGLTLIPLRFYFKRGVVKVELGLCKGKKTHDKRATIQERDVKREMDRAAKEFRRG